MYKVFFDSLEIYNDISLENALAFALNFHRASNIPHSIKVYDPMKNDCIISLIRKPHVKEEVPESPAYGNY